jgi:hypothetical protein
LVLASSQLLGGWQNVIIGEQVSGRGVGEENVVTSPYYAFQNVETVRCD